MVPAQECQSHRGRVTCASFGSDVSKKMDTDGNMELQDVTYVTGGENRRAYVWQLGQPQPKYTLAAPEGSGAGSAIEVIRYNTHSNRVMGGTSRGSVVLWALPATDGGKIRSMRLPKGHGQGVVDADFHPYGDMIFSVGKDGLAKVWDVEKGVCVQQYRMDAPITCAAFSPHGEWLTLCGQDGQVETYDMTNSKKPIHRFKELHAITSIDFSQQQLHFAVSTTNKRISIYNIESNTFTSTGYQPDSIQKIKIHPQTGHLYAFGSDSLRMYSQMPLDSVLDWEEADWGNSIQDCMFLKSTGGRGDSVLTMTLNEENVSFWKMDGLRDIEEVMPPSSSAQSKPKQQPVVANPIEESKNVPQTFPYQSPGGRNYHAVLFPAFE